MPLPIQEIEAVRTLQVIQCDYEEAQISQGFWSLLSRFVKWECVQKRATQAQHRLEKAKQQLAQYSAEHTFSSNEYAQQLNQFALSSAEQPFEWV